MKKLKLLIPLALLFISPWFHWIVFKNILLAWPELEISSAHIIAIIGTFIAFFATTFIVDTGI